MKNIEINIGNNISTYIKQKMWYIIGDKLYGNAFVKISTNIWDNIRFNIHENIHNSIRKLKNSKADRP